VGEALLDPLIDRDRIEGDKEYREELRYRCITDGFFLAPFLGFNDFRRDVHQPVADLYVVKKPGLSIPDQDPQHKYRIHLDPRHTFKTTWGILDTVQWILVSPDITIVNETATQALAKLLTTRVAKVFHRPKKTAKPPTLFQTLFPEYVFNTKLTSTYRAPCCTRDEVEPTLYWTSVGSAQSGYHPWVINPDDMVDAENSGITASDQSREAVWSTYTTNKNTLRHGGYENVRGTRYHPFDAYGRMLETLDPTTTKVLIRQSLILKDKEARLIEGEFPERDEIAVLPFESLGLTYEFLRAKFRAEYRTFMCQQQNDPQGGGVALWTQESYRQMLVEAERIPPTGEVRVCWRLQASTKNFLEQYAYGVAVLYSGSRCYVIDAWRGAYTPSELCERIVKGCKRNQCGELTIEQTPGSDSIIPHIYNEATRQNWSLRIDRPEFESDDDARHGRMRNLQPMTKAGRLWVSTIAGQNDEVQKQFVHFGLIEENGFPDVISRLALRIPASVFRGQVTEEQRQLHRMAAERGLWDALFGDGGAAEIQESIQAEEERPQQFQNSYGLRPMLGGLDG
jgi:hypothetical protein